MFVYILPSCRSSTVDKGLNGSAGPLGAWRLHHIVFSKIRIDVNSMQIKTTDLLFAQTIFGKAVPFATAGDCYSAARCPQGQFSINLAGTGMKISSTAKWLAQGNYASVIIHRSQDGTKVYGRCGGFCGKCVPHMTTGLPIQVG